MERRKLTRAFGRPVSSQLQSNRSVWDTGHVEWAVDLVEGIPQQKKKSWRFRFFRSDQKYWPPLILTFVSISSTPPSPQKAPFDIKDFFFSLGKPNHECFGPFIGWWGGESRLIHPLGRQNMWFIIFWSRACRTMNFHLSSKNVGRSGYLLPAWSV